MNDSKPFKLGVMGFESAMQQFINNSCRYCQITEKVKYDEYVRGFEHALAVYIRDILKENHGL